MPRREGVIGLVANQPEGPIHDQIDSYSPLSTYKLAASPVMLPDWQ